VEVWDATRLQRTTRIAFPSVVHVAATRDARQIAVVGDAGDVQIRDAARGRPLVDLATSDDPVVGVEFRPDGRAIALGRFSGALRVVDRNGRPLIDVRLAQTALNAVAFSPDGESLAAVAGTANRILVVESRTGRRNLSIRPPDPGINTIGFSPDGRRLIAGGNDGAWIWDARDSRLMLRLRGHLGPVGSASFSPDGELIATASSDGETRLWDAATGDLITSMSGTNASFGGRRLIFTTGGGSTGRLYACDPCGSVAALSERARKFNTRPYTPSQLEAFILG
jgi:WD40 repeat protein